MIKPEEEIKKFIKKQLAFNSGKNLFADAKNNSLTFIQVDESIVRIVKDMDEDTETKMINSVVDEVIQEFCTVNQYYSFDSGSLEELKQIYKQLNSSIRILNGNLPSSNLETISHQHFQKLSEWLLKSNAFAKKIYNPTEEFAQPVACSEYSAELQLTVLGVELKKLREPILDIGCGREMNLVNYVRQFGLEAFGIDRFEVENPFYEKTDWLEYAYEANKWGTIISNLAFSNHFVHHNLRTDGNYVVYTKKYMEILQSLQPNGSFYYSPSLPFIETHLDKSKFSCINNQLEGYVYQSSIITKLL